MGAESARRILFLDGFVEGDAASASRSILVINIFFWYVLLWEIRWRVKI